MVARRATWTQSKATKHIEVSKFPVDSHPLGPQYLLSTLPWSDTELNAGN